MSWLLSSILDRTPLLRTGALLAATATPLAIATTPASAVSLSIGGGSLNFQARSGDFNIQGGTVTGNTITLFQDVTGTDLDLVLQIDGLTSLTSFDVVDEFGMPAGSVSGFWFESVLTNRSDRTWEFFDHELQSNLGTPSSHGDGLAFGLPSGKSIPSYSDFTPTSDRFSDIQTIRNGKDAIAFSNGLVDPGETVTFRYFIADSTPASPVFLRQFSQVSSLPPDPVDVPEPHLLLGLFAITTLETLRRRDRHR
ncbi:hypothetical protein POG22_14310 [Geitlerinema sp. CS-897]|nr:hypothetical protein [Geitlerinema sp. CS-897]